jgi:hypothetical protein
MIDRFIAPSDCILRQDVAMAATTRAASSNSRSGWIHPATRGTTVATRKIDASAAAKLRGGRDLIQRADRIWAHRSIQMRQKQRELQPALLEKWLSNQ